MYRILLYAPIKHDATSFYRSYGPMRHLAKLRGIEIIDLAIPGAEIEWDGMAHADIFFCQRPSSVLELRLMEVAKNSGVPIWVDYDDDYLNIPVTNPRHELYGNLHRVEVIKRCIEFADVISVSTPAIMHSIIERLKIPAGRFEILPNAVDETLFDVEFPIDKVGDRDVIMWRGGDTHQSDIEPFLDVLVRLYYEFPDYKWVFVGHPSQKFLERIDSSRVTNHLWMTVMAYFDRLFEIRPKVTLVPWEVNKFNAAKSNCAWLESTLAGAVTLFPNWSTEVANGMVTYTNPDDFYALTQSVLQTKDLTATLTEAQKAILKHYTLYSLVDRRMAIIERLVWQRRSVLKKLGFNNPKYRIEPKVYSDLEFFNYTHERMLNQDYEGYRNGHFEVAQKILDDFKPESILEFGCGPGPMVEYFCDKKVPQVIGFDSNPYFKEYFDKRNPHYKANFVIQNMLEVEMGGVFDLGISIECFEHIPMEVLLPFLKKLPYHFRHFYFSSTPYSDDKNFMIQWGHVNVNTYEKWKELFVAAGFKFVDNPQWISQWDQLYESTLISSLAQQTPVSLPLSDSLPQSAVESPADPELSAPQTESSETSPETSPAPPHPVPST